MATEVWNDSETVTICVLVRQGLEPQIPSVQYWQRLGNTFYLAQKQTRQRPEAKYNTTGYLGIQELKF